MYFTAAVSKLGVLSNTWKIEIVTMTNSENVHGDKYDDSNDGDFPGNGNGNDDGNDNERQNYDNNNNDN